jgi:ABC-type glycerol-3-phosphate transport system substrate-binding protein
MKKRNAIILTAALSLSVALFAGGCADKTSTSDNGTSTTTAEKVTPTFMYFYTNNDTDVVEPLVENLKSEYDGKVNFSIINIDENPEALENFSLVSGNTPALIMLNTDNDISNLEFQCTDEETLKADIEEALK